MNRREFFKGLLAVATIAAAPVMYVARKLHWVNVLDYGADPRGIMDSTQALAAAVNAIEDGGVVYLPQGTYRVGDFDSVKGTGFILGDGWSETKIIRWRVPC